MTGLYQDLRIAVRRLRQAPAFALVAIAVLAVGIAASAVVFSVADTVLLRPLPFVQSDRLAMIQTSAGSRLSSGYLYDWRAGSRAFEDFTGWHDVRQNLTGRGAPLEVSVDRVTSNFFRVLGTPALVGRTFTVGPETAVVEPEVVLSYGLWQRVYGGDTRVIGQSVTLDADVFSIVGVMPRGFAVRTTELTESRADLWIPFRLVPDSRIGMGGILTVIGRLAPGVTTAQAQAELAVIAERIEQQYPSYSREWRVGVLPLYEATVRDVRLRILLLFAAVAIVLVISCANVASVVLSRASGRQAEVAIRQTLGATRSRLLRQFLTESVVLAACGGILGVLLAVGGTLAVVWALPPEVDLPRIREMTVDVRMLVFACVVTMLTAILIGLVPAWRAAGRGDPKVRDATLLAAAGPRRIGRALLVVEMALSVMLLTAAGLLVRTVWALAHVPLGFQPAQVLTIRTTLPPSRYDTQERVRTFSRTLLERLEHLPGVQAVGSVNYLPLSRFGFAAVFDIEGRPFSRPAD